MNCKEVFKIIKNKNLKIAFAESITGGKLASDFVSNSGASKYFELALVVYSNQMKEKYLQIPLSLIDEYGVVSKEVSSLMAQNIKSLANSNIGIGISGNAGPKALKKSKVGEVWLSVAFDDNVYSYFLNITKDKRKSIINEAVNKTWEILGEILNK